MFVAMNRFEVRAGKEPEFEALWRERETYLQQTPGFLAFALLRNREPGGGTTEYVSHSTWRSREDFEAWRASDAFTRGHAQASLHGLLAGPPKASLYEAVLEETKTVDS
ncbi:MAG TPA: antibiotic biosynthesis monooxygenase [Dehalococcoidia bacterium]|nr:antibiotic biosynthesis monooxygenase [Dehalococcoidia bacterium]